MAEQRLTDNEIIKALEKRVNYDCESDCSFKSALCLKEFCDVFVDRNILDLINRQKAEIERLLKAGAEAVDRFTRIESLYKIKCKELEVTKSKAYKEFAEMLKQCVYKHSDICGCQSIVIDANSVAYFLEKMTSGNLNKLDHSSLCETETAKG